MKEKPHPFIIPISWSVCGRLSEEATGVAALKVGTEIMRLVSSKPSVIVRKQQESRGKERLNMWSRVWESWCPRISPVSPLPLRRKPLYFAFKGHWNKDFHFNWRAMLCKSISITSAHKYNFFFLVNKDFSNLHDSPAFLLILMLFSNPVWWPMTKGCLQPTQAIWQQLKLWQKNKPKHRASA